MTPAAASAAVLATFTFAAPATEAARQIIAKYPPGRQASAVIPLLYLVQRQEGWVPPPAMDYLAEMLDIPAIRVYEVATFYTMFNLKPVGRHHVQVCTNLSCWLRGSDEIVAALRKRFGIDFGETTADGQVTMTEVECMGACVNAPMMQVGDDFYEDLTPETALKVLDDLLAGGTPHPGSQIGRRSSEPAGGLTTLKPTAAAAGAPGER